MNINFWITIFCTMEHPFNAGKHTGKMICCNTRTHTRTHTHTHTVLTWRVVKMAVAVARTCKLLMTKHQLAIYALRLTTHYCDLSALLCINTQQTPNNQRRGYKRVFDDWTHPRRTVAANKAKFTTDRRGWSFHMLLLHLLSALTVRKTAQEHTFSKQIITLSSF